MIGIRLRRALGAASIIGLALTLAPNATAAPAVALTSSSSSATPAPAALSAVGWGTDNRVTWSLNVPAGTVVIVAIDYLERSQTIGPVPAAMQLTVSIDANGAPADQLTLAVWRIPGHDQGSVSLTLTRPRGVPVTVFRPVPSARAGRFPNG